MNSVIAFMFYIDTGRSSSREEFSQEEYYKLPFMKIKESVQQSIFTGIGNATMCFYNFSEA